MLGFDIRAVGANARAAAFAGVPVTRTVVWVALLSGGLAGLAGAIEVAGRTSYLTLDMSPGYGYSGIVIAMLAGLHPLGVVAGSVFGAGVLVGADSMSRVMGVPTYIADVIVATSLIAVLVATLLTQYRVRWKWADCRTLGYGWRIKALVAECDRLPDASASLPLHLWLNPQGRPSGRAPHTGVPEIVTRPEGLPR